MATQSPVAYICVFDREQCSSADLAAIEPYEAIPARFATREAAEARKTSYERWDRKRDWSIFEGSVPMYVRENGRTWLNPAHEEARYEVRVISAEWLEREGSWLKLD